ncbi:MAG: FeoB-associated Cys-rich membrane protein [Anaerohalosphaeraceae bacterium]|nr:FeoB-associated Cys-rich membrane protein [Anaerohalosphaeraceae bacterium]
MEIVIVLLIVGLAIAAGVWTFRRAIKGKGSCSGNCSMCSKTKNSNN